MSLSDAVQDLAARGLESGAERLPEAIERGKAWAKAQGVPGLPEAMDAMQPAVPVLAAMAKAELSAFLGRAFASVEEGDLELAGMAFEERRALSRAVAQEAVEEAERAEARAQALGAVLSGLGEAAKVVLPVLIAAL